MTKKDVSALAPINADGASTAEEEKSSSWLARQAATSLTGRVVMSAYESLKTAGTVVCLSPWGDSSPLIIPSVRFRDLLIESVMAATGGTSTIAAPALDPLSDALSSSLGDTVVAQLVSDAATNVITDAADDKFIEGPIEDRMPDYGKQHVSEGAEGVKTVLVSLKYKHMTTDAALGFYRSSLHQDSSPDSLFSNVKDYLATEKGWFSPYLFASGRRPVIPRTITPDVVFCHGPFLSGDYKIGQILLSESTVVASFSADWSGVPPTAAAREGDGKGGGAGKLLGGLRKKWGKDGEEVEESGTTDEDKGDKKAAKAAEKEAKKAEKEEKAARKAEEKEAKAQAKADEKAKKAEKTADKAAAEDAASSSNETTAVPRHIAVFLVGIKPHRGSTMWSSSQRPGESVVRYQLLSTLPALVLPAKLGAPLIAWDAQPLAELRKLGENNYTSHADSLCEFLDMCVDWTRVGGGRLQGKGVGEKEKKDAVRSEVRLLVGNAMRAGQGVDGKNGVDAARAGVVFWRVP
ncbi:hypothetical protein EXIGLDRAFT_744408 [Exidia glandulosa HHB12029]|uniref:Uncharacterized protein n=1 Tax=Exidia glandulosa HHB12029 TaxID=1314781 RepID=A0A165Q0Y4_EXIGL|nr:hypothetical protein EXIGLDRAFT_744408 [Exidia glandulosa HHB12029]